MEKLPYNRLQPYHVTRVATGQLNSTLPAKYFNLSFWWVTGLDPEVRINPSSKRLVKQSVTMCRMSFLPRNSQAKPWLNISLFTADLSSNTVRPQNMRWESSFTMRFCEETQERHQLPHKFEPDKCGRIRPKNCRRGSCMNPQNWKLGIDVQSTNIKTEEVTAYKTWLPPTTRTARHQGCHQHLRHHLPNDDISKAQLDFLMAQDYKTQLWGELTLLWWLINLYP